MWWRIGSADLTASDLGEVLQNAESRKFDPGAGRGGIPEDAGDGGRPDAEDFGIEDDVCGRIALAPARPALFAGLSGDRVRRAVGQGAAVRQLERGRAGDAGLVGVDPEGAT